MVLDEKSPLALYHQLKDIMIAKIKNGEWAVDSKIPTERELCDIYRISRMTVRLALDELEKAGYLYRKQGKGTFLTTPKITQRLSRFYSFSEEISQMGYKPATTMLAFDMIQPQEGLCRVLSMKAHSDVYRIKRIRLADNEPFALETSYVPCEVCPGLTEAEVAGKGLYNAMKCRCGLVPDTAEEAFEAIIIKAEDASLLHAARNSPGLFLERLTHSGGTAVEYCSSIIRGDRFKYKVVLK